MRERASTADRGDPGYLAFLLGFLVLVANGVAIGLITQQILEPGTRFGPTTVAVLVALLLNLILEIVRRRIKPPGPGILAWSVVIVVVVAAVVFWTWPRQCTKPDLVRVATTPAMLPVYQDLAQGFERSAGACPRAELYVYDVPSLADAAIALRDGWAGDTMRLAGPQPDLFLAGSTAAVDLIEHVAADAEVGLDRLGSVASSPIVVAEPVTGGNPEPGALLWSDLLRVPDGATQSERPQQANPTTSALGLLSTAALYQFGVLNGATPTPALLDEHDFRQVQQAVGIGGEHQTAVLDKLDPARGQARPRGVIVPEQAVVAWNEARDCLAGECIRASYPPEDAEAVQLDFPAMLVTGAGWVDSDRQRIAREFVSYLRDDQAQLALADHGLRTARGAPTVEITADRGVNPDWQVEVTQGTSSRLDGPTLDAVRRTWERDRQPVRLVLAVDRSLSMATGALAGTRMDEAKRAVEDVLSLVGQRDRITVWSYGERGGGPHHDPLVPPDPAGGPTLAPADAEQLTAIRDALRDLQPRREGTRLYDTIAAAVEVLEASPARDAPDVPVDVVIVVTDGRDSDRGMTKQQLMAVLAGQDSTVYALAHGDASCQDLRELTSQTGGSCRDAGLTNLERTMRQLSTAFWGALP